MDREDKIFSLSSVYVKALYDSGKVDTSEVLSDFYKLQITVIIELAMSCEGSELEFLNHTLKGFKETGTEVQEKAFSKAEKLLNQMLKLKNKNKNKNKDKDKDNE